MALLDGLDQVDWAHLSHAYGVATDVPGLLRALAFPRSPKEQAAAQHDLYGNVIHQGSVWSVSSRVVPFLVEIALAESSGRRLREWTLQYLLDLALPVESALERFDPEELFADAIDPGTWSESDRRTEEEEEKGLEQMAMVWAKECYDAVERQLPELLPLIDQTDVEIAEATMTLAMIFPRMSAVVAPRLRSLAERFDAPTSRPAAALVALAVVEPIQGQKLAERFFATSKDDMLELIAACASAIADPTSISAGARELVEDAEGPLPAERALVPLDRLLDESQMRLSDA